MDVAILGATGDVGRQLCTQLLLRRVLPHTSRLQLVGRSGGSSGRACAGLRNDLIDAFDEIAPWIDVALSPDELVADVIVMTAGATVGVGGGSVSREQLAERNAEVFSTYAEALARHGSGQEVVIVVSNPVELGVAVFAEHLGRHRVIGMGAWLDTLRFRREIATTTGLHRQQVGGFAVGQHGEDLVPLWSTVRLQGMHPAESAALLAEVRGDRDLEDYAREFDVAKKKLAKMEGGAPEAFRYVESLPPDVRTSLRPWLTQNSGAKTASATAAATIDLIEVVLGGREIVVAGQVALDGEIALGGAPFTGVLGVPVVVGPNGWSSVLLGDLADDETRRLERTAARIGDAVRPWVAAA